MKTKKYLLTILSLLMTIVLLSGCLGNAADSDTGKDSSKDLPDSNESSGNAESSNASGTDSSGNSSLTTSSGHARPWVGGNYRPPAVAISGSSSSGNSTSSSNDNTDDKPPTEPIYTKAELYNLVDYLTFKSDNYAIGLHLYGGLDVRRGISNFEKRAGKKPAFIDFDMNNLEFVTESAKKTAASNLIKFAKSDGFIAITDHWLTPTTHYTNAESGGANNSRGVLTRDQFYEVMTAGTTLNKNFLDELAIKAEFLKILQQNGIPVIYRPLHEANGAWFWWGIHPDQGITGADVAELYRYVYRYFTETCGLDNILWQFNTAMAGPQSVLSDWYPGDEYVDILSTDWYIPYGDSKETYEKMEAKCASAKPFTISEYGGDGNYDVRDYTLKQTLSKVESDMDRGAKIGYIGLYFEMDDVQDWSLPSRAITLDQMSGYWSLSKD